MIPVNMLVMHRRIDDPLLNSLDISQSEKYQVNLIRDKLIILVHKVYVFGVVLVFSE